MDEASVVSGQKRKNPAVRSWHRMTPSTFPLLLAFTGRNRSYVIHLGYKNGNCQKVDE
jgi:hypothetical protein